MNRSLFHLAIIDMDSGIAVLISAILASAGWLYQARVQLRMARKRHTFDSFQLYRGDGVHSSRHEEVRKLLQRERKRVGIPDQATLVKIDPDAQTDSDLELMLFFLNKYEELAVSVYAGDLDELYFKGVEKTTVTRICFIFEEFVEYKRTKSNQPSLFEYIVCLSRRWGDSSPLPWGDRIYEWWKMRPMYPPSRPPACAKLNELQERWGFR